MSDDIYLDVQAAMTPDERSTFLATFTTLNPHWDGADVADVLAELANADALLSLTEPAYEDHGDKVPESGLIGATVRAIAFAYPTQPISAPWDKVEDLIRRVRALR